MSIFVYRRTVIPRMTIISIVQQPNWLRRLQSRHQGKKYMQVSTKTRKRSSLSIQKKQH
jgi:hypothetical protein